MESMDPIEPADNDMQDSTGERSDSATTLPLLGVGLFGLLSLVNAGVLFASGLGVAAADTVSGSGLLPVASEGGLLLATGVLALGAVDLLVAWGLYRMQLWAWWSAIAVFAVHTVTGASANYLFPILAILCGIGLIPISRPFRRAQ